VSAGRRVPARVRLRARAPQWNTSIVAGTAEACAAFRRHGFCSSEVGPAAIQPCSRSMFATPGRWEPDAAELLGDVHVDHVVTMRHDAPALTAGGRGARGYRGARASSKHRAVPTAADLLDFAGNQCVAALASEAWRGKTEGLRRPCRTSPSVGLHRPRAPQQLSPSFLQALALRCRSATSCAKIG
jgi:hypothetical protein